MITNRDPGDETTYELCGETCYQYVDTTRDDTYPTCRMPRGHKGSHSTWYYDAKPFFGFDGPESNLKVKKDE
jgi:hypothetical protein